MTRLDQCNERYCHDATYRAFVDMMAMHIRALDLSPSELREAAMYACYVVETTRPLRCFNCGSAEHVLCGSKAVSP